MLKKNIGYLSIKYLRFRYYLLKAKFKGRYKQSKVSFSGYKLEVVDMLSFAWQYWEIVWKECYAFKADTSKPIIIDCGGNIGLSALYFSHLYPNGAIKVIEADKKIAEICKKNIADNKKLNIEVINKAVWVNNGFISFNSDGADGGKIDKESIAEKIPCVDFNEFIEPFQKIDFVKIDIEGAEIEVITHIKNQLPKIQYLFIEYHSVSTTAQRLGDLLSLLQQKGFRYYIEDLHKKQKPMLSTVSTAIFDLQLNIYARNTKF